MEKHSQECLALTQRLINGRSFHFALILLLSFKTSFLAPCSLLIVMQSGLWGEAGGSPTWLLSPSPPLLSLLLCLGTVSSLLALNAFAFVICLTPYTNCQRQYHRPCFTAEDTSVPQVTCPRPPCKSLKGSGLQIVSGWLQAQCLFLTAVLGASPTSALLPRLPGRN